MTGAVTLEPGVNVFVSPDPLPLACGGRIDGFRLGYELQGLAGAPLVIVQGGISAGSHVASSGNNPEPGWWEALVGPGKPIDTSRFRVLSMDFLGGQGASTGPGSGRPRSGESLSGGPRSSAAGGDSPFPAVTSHDQAEASGRLLDELGVDRVHAFVGSSYGGMVGLAFARRYPSRLRHLVAISAPERSHSWATALRTLQRRVLRRGVQQGCAVEAVEIARGIGMVTYRSPGEFEQRFASDWQRTEGQIRFPVEEYLEACGRRHSARTTAEAYHALSLAIDLHQVDPSEVRVPATIVGASSDLLVPFAQLERLTARLAGPARLVCISSPHGHDAFLKEVGQLAPILRQALGEVDA